ncbi:hypothetical protein Tco_0079372, partial [Tanacetum coccineum]
MDPYNHTTPTSTKLPILETGKFEQWKFRIQQYLQHEHYALWEVIEFGDSYKALPEEAGKDVVGEGSAKKKGRTVALTAQKTCRNEKMMSRQELLYYWLSLMRFSKYDTAKEFYIADEEENHTLVADNVVPTEFSLIAMSSSSSDNE